MTPGDGSAAVPSEPRRLRYLPDACRCGAYGVAMYCDCPQAAVYERVTVEEVGPVSEAPTDEEIARLFHDTYERLAPTFDYETRRSSAVAWEQVPSRNKALMVAVAGEVRAVLSAAREVKSDG